jgi:hypothetical protein
LLLATDETRITEKIRTRFIIRATLFNQKFNHR